MDYRGIVIKGYSNYSTSESWKDYFIRQFKNAKKEDYSANEFFEGCLNEIRLIFEGDLESINQFGLSIQAKIDEKKLKLIRNQIEEAKQIILSKNNSKPYNLEPLDFNLNQTDLVHFFDLLVDADIIKEPTNEAHKKTKGGFFGKLSKYFTAKGKPINSNSAKQVQTNKNIKQSPYSETYYKMLRDLKQTIDKKLSKFE